MRKKFYQIGFDNIFGVLKRLVRSEPFEKEKEGNNERANEEKKKQDKK